MKRTQKQILKAMKKSLSHWETVEISFDDRNSSQACWFVTNCCASQCPLCVFFGRCSSECPLDDSGKGNDQCCKEWGVLRAKCDKKTAVFQDIQKVTHRIRSEIQKMEAKLPEINKERMFGLKCFEGYYHSCSVEGDTISAQPTLMQYEEVNYLWALLPEIFDLKKYGEFTIQEFVEKEV